MNYLKIEIILASIFLTINSVALAASSDNHNESENNVEFNTSFGGLDSGKIDISHFERSGQVPAGDYLVDIYLNDALVSRERVKFINTGENNVTAPCFDISFLQKIGVDMDKVSVPSGDNKQCVLLTRELPQATVNYDSENLKLYITVPQVDLKRQARGYVSPELWDHGITTATLGYSFNGYEIMQNSNDNSRGYYLGVNTGFNVMQWRLRSQSSATWNNTSGSHWQNVNTYMQRDIAYLRSQFTLGESFTTGELFPSNAFRGASLVSDDRMLPAAMNSYAPTVRGIADTRARIEIRQKGILVYETEVAPGAFEIDDLYATNYSGDLQVSIIEADGRVRTFIVPYAAVPMLIRPGNWRYASTVGQLRNANDREEKPVFGELTLQHGINNWLTGYTGLQTTDDKTYLGALVGAAVNTPIGATSIDITKSKANIAHDSSRWEGYSIRATYSKVIEPTSTNLALATYRYSSAKYLNLSDAVDLSRKGNQSLSFQAKNQYQIAINQPLGDAAGTVYASGTYYDYWNGLANNKTYQLGYSNQFGKVNYTLSMNRVYSGDSKAENSFFLSLSVPLGSQNAPMVSASLTGGGDRNGSVRVGISDSVGENNQFNYNVSATKNQGSSGDLDASGNWSTPYSVLGGSYGVNRDRQQLSLNASGGVVAHSGGVTFAPRISETMGLVEAKGAEGALVVNGSQNKVDQHGYAIVADLTPYRMNDITLDPKGTAMDVELGSNRANSAPTAGAIVLLKYDTTIGTAVMIEAFLPDGKNVPFGAEVLDEHNKQIGIVGQNGMIFLRGVEDNSLFTVRWGDDAGQTCKLQYHSSADTANSSKQELNNIKSVCR